MEKQTAEMIVKIYAVFYWIAALVYLVVGLALIFGGSILGALGGGMIGLGELEMGALGSLAGAVGLIAGVLTLAFAAFSVWVGFGLWRREYWARVAAIVLSVFALFSFPLGTIVGALGIAFFGFSDEVIDLFVKKTSKRKKG